MIASGFRTAEGLQILELAPTSGFSVGIVLGRAQSYQPTNSQPTVWKLIQTTKSTYLEAQTELSGKLVIFYYETHAATRLQAVLEP